MATGGIFQLITNDGKQDRMLMASALLKQRIDDARKRREAAGDSDCTPTLYDIERTHILFTNAHFKPFAAIGYEYNKVSTSAGTSALGGKITFSIPQFGDFFNDMVVHAVIEQPVLATTINGVDIPASKQNLFRWCDFPGERLLKGVSFEVNGNPLDSYTSDAINYHREFCVQPNKEIAWHRCVGQEVHQKGFIDQPNWQNNGVPSSDIEYRTSMSGYSGLQTPTGVKNGDVELFIPLLFWCNKDPRLAVPSVAIPYGQRFINIELAPSQELVGEYPRGYSPTLTESEIWSATNIAAGGAFTSLANLKYIELYINNIFVNPEVHNIFIKRIGFTLIRVHRRQTYESSGGTESLLLQNLKWPIEALFVGMKVSDYHKAPTADIGRSHLDKWYKFSTITNEARTTQGWSGTKATVSEFATFLDLLPGSTMIEFSPLAAGRSPVMTSDAASAVGRLSVGDVLSFTSVEGNTVGPLTVSSLGPLGLNVTFAENSADVLNYVDVANRDVLQPLNLATNLSIVSNTSSEIGYHVDVASRNLLWVTIKAHGIPIYNAFPTGFFNAYVPYNYGGHNIRAPDDVGALMITFCLYPGTYQPSGHINISRAREFYIDFETSPNISSQSGSRGTLVIVASAINFLLISDGSAVLRYST